MEDTACFRLGLREEEEGKGFAFRARDGREHSQGRPPGWRWGRKLAGEEEATKVLGGKGIRGVV